MSENNIKEFKEKTSNYINSLEKENQQLKQLNKVVYVDKSEKILDELEKWLDEENKKTFIDIVSISAYEKVSNKIKELKGSNVNV